MMPPLKTPLTGRRAALAKWVEGKQVTRFITALIVLNAITLGMETSRSIMEAIGPALLILDKAILAVFVVEVLIKLYAYRWSFFRSGWNVFDFLIVGIALMPASGSLSVLRAFRILRVLRLFSVVPAMRRVIQALFHAIPGMTSVVALLIVVFYVAAVLSTKLFGLSPVASEDTVEWFGTIGASMYTLFQIMTLESWSMGIVRPVMEEFPLAWVFFVPFVIFTSFAVLNLFIGIIVDAMQSIHHDEHEESESEIIEAGHQDTAQLSAEIQALRAEIRDLRSALAPATGAPTSAAPETDPDAEKDPS